MNYAPPSLALPGVSFIHFSFLASVPVLVAILILFLLIYTAVSSALIYHWSHYGMGNHGIQVAETLFLFVSLFLFISAGLSIYYY